MDELAHFLAKFLDEGISAFHVVAAIEQRLVSNGFEKLKENEIWRLKDNHRYYVTRNGSSIVAFKTSDHEANGFLVGASHSDSPSFKVKENPEIVDNNYVKVNTEGYGGMLCAPWLDRPLSVAGRAIVRDGKGYSTRLVNVDKDFLVIPSLAIHMNREANDGKAYNKQVDMLPIIGSLECKGMFMETVAQSLGVAKEDIVSHDLYLYVREKSRIIGACGEYVMGPHLDDLQCCFGNMEGFLASENQKIAVLAVFDNEEVGSLTKQGASSMFLSDTLERIALSLGKDRQGLFAMLANSFMVSADNSHAIHPNHPEAADPVNRPQINKGIVIKSHASQKYTTDAMSSAVFKAVCDKAGVPIQYFTNRSDKRSGSTLGNLATGHVSINTLDIGLPMLAMHSCYETAGTKDAFYLKEAMRTFFSSNLRMGEDCFTLE